MDDTKIHEPCCTKKEPLILDNLDFPAVHKQCIHSVVHGISLHSLNRCRNANGPPALDNTRYQCNRTPANVTQSKSYFKTDKKLVTKQWNVPILSQIPFWNL